MLEISNCSGNGQLNIVHKLALFPEYPDGRDKALAFISKLWIIEVRKKNQQCICFYQNIILVKMGAIKLLTSDI